MRVGLLTWAYPPEKSGLSRAAREIAEALAAAGCDVRVLTLDRADRGFAGDVEVIGCAPGRTARRLRAIAGIGHFVGPATFARAVRAEHRRRPFDVIEATNWYGPGLFVGLAARLPLVVRNSTPAATTIAAAHGVRARIDAAIARAAEHVAARNARGLVSNTAIHARKIAALYGVAMPGPSHAVIGLSLPPEIVARGRAAVYPIDAPPVRLLFVGRAEPRKGFAELLDALERLTAEGRPFQALLIGVNDADVSGLSPTARAHVETRHRVPEAALHEAYAAAHVVLAPSRYESFGLVYQEAMAFGRPILACAEDPSARLFVGDSGAGRLASACTGAAIAEALRPLIVDAELRERLAAASVAASGRFDRASLARETLALYDVAIGGPR